MEEGEDKRKKDCVIIFHGCRLIHVGYSGTNVGREGSTCAGTAQIAGFMISMGDGVETSLQKL